MKYFCLILVLVLSAATSAWCMVDRPLPDPVAEARAVALGDRLRCVVCQSESINASQAAMAYDLRQLVRDKIQAGWTDRQILDFARARYGDFILLSPPVQANTSLLWLSPAVFALLATGVVFLYLRRRHTPGTDHGEHE